MIENFNGNSCVDVENAGKDEGTGSIPSECNSNATHDTIGSMDTNVFKAFDENTPNVEWALRYAKAGYKVLPLFYIMPDGYCSCRGTGLKHTDGIICPNGSPAKHPQNLVHRKGVQDATTDEKKIRASWSAMPGSNIGIKCDKAHALDIDGEEGLQSLLKKDKNNELVNPDGTFNYKGPLARTGKATKGYNHLLFKPPEGVIIPGTVGFLPGLDYRSNGNYIVVAPSNHISGNKYEWINSPFDCEPQEMPKFLLDILMENVTKRVEVSFSSEERIKTGERNATLFGFAGFLRNKGLEFKEIKDTLMSINKNRCDNPLDDREIETIAQSICKYEKTHKVTDSAKKNPTSVLTNAVVKLLRDEKDARLIFNSLGKPFLWIKTGDHFEMVELNHNNIAFKKFCFRLLQEKHKLTLRDDETFKMAKLAIEVRAEDITRAKGLDPNSPLGYRRTWHNNAAWYDLCNQDWAGIEIDENGYRKSALPPIFLRRGSEKPQIEPVYNAKPEEVDRIFKYINVIDTDKKLLLKAWLCASIVPIFKGYSLPQPILSFGGVTGSGKTVGAKFIKSIIDPSGVEVRRLPEKIDDLGVMLNRNGLLIFDNIGTKISDDMSDVLCIATTKGHDTKRKLYTDDEEAILKLDSSIIFTSIYINKMNEDLINRSLFIETSKLKDRRQTELSLNEEFKKDLPYILGGIFASISEALKIHPLDIKVGNGDIRMLDFALFGEALSRVWGNKEMKLFTTYINMQEDKISEAIGENPTLGTLAAYMKKNKSFYGPLSNLLVKLKDFYTENEMGENVNYFVSNSTAFSKKLKKEDNALASMGIQVVPDLKQTNGKTYYQIDYVSDTQTNQEGW